MPSLPLIRRKYFFFVDLLIFLRGSKRGLFYTRSQQNKTMDEIVDQMLFTHNNRQCKITTPHFEDLFEEFIISVALPI